MRIQIQNWWGAEILDHTKAMKDSEKLDAEQIIKNLGSITVCTILVDNKIVGCVNWDGKELRISRELVSINRGKTQ